MRLRIEGARNNVRVVNAETGEELVGVKRVRWDSDSFIGGCQIELSDAAIDVSVPSADVTAYGHERNRFARLPLLDVAGLRWLRRKEDDVHQPDA